MSDDMATSKVAAATKFIRWIEQQVLAAGRGDDESTLDVEPSGRFWLGRIACVDDVRDRDLGDRGERLDPCAVGIRFVPAEPPPWSFTAQVRFVVWVKQGNSFVKSTRIDLEVPLSISGGIFTEQAFGAEAIANRCHDVVGISGHSGEVRTEVAPTREGIELIVTLVNTTPRDAGVSDRNFYETSLTVRGVATRPYELEATDDSFRYDRRVQAYGINCGVSVTAHEITTEDLPAVDQPRHAYWPNETPPDLRFATLAATPVPALEYLVDAHKVWGTQAWSDARLDLRADQEAWSESMRRAAREERSKFDKESERLDRGLELLRSDDLVRRAFVLMNEAFQLSAAGKYDGWRPFQVGFLLANLESLTSNDASGDVADVIWFPTGGGKTETYLGLIVTAAFYERLNGRAAGVTAWSRFPLRMLSLQQTQRFANAMAAAELIRRRQRIEGEPFSVGFLVGGQATPNEIKPEPTKDDPDPYDDDMPKRYQVLLECPFCRQSSVEMAFNRLHWTLEHRCNNAGCEWPEVALPFYIVDQEIFRFLPTVIVGTLDKAAGAAMQGAMRGIIAAPVSFCSVERHGFSYVPRANRPQGCLVPGCRGQAMPLGMPAERYRPSFRLQDELHLLRDSLGAVDAHYESLLDHLEATLTGRRSKILASSATLKGFERQVGVLYSRAARVFPFPSPDVTHGFWASDTDTLARRFVAVAPRGVTIDFALDRITTVLQTCVRMLRSDPVALCAAIGIDPKYADSLVNDYGTDVIYGNTLRDLDAVMRSLETQVLVDGALNAESLTGRAEFENVRVILDRLERPEPSFTDRIHVVVGSAMMSHGVDIDRLNIMTMLGLPLTTSEFIQATARVGRLWPGLVFVLHKIGRERDASVFRSFTSFVKQSDRFVEPIAITRRSRRVLARTLPGLMIGRILAVHEPNARRSLFMASRLRAHFQSADVTAESETSAIIDCLSLSGSLDSELREDVATWVSRFFRNLNDPSGTYQNRNDLCGGDGPMRSLRDVEEQAPVYGVDE